MLKDTQNYFQKLVERHNDSDDWLFLNGYKRESGATYWTPELYNRYINDYIVKLDLQQGFNVLDVGCGSGYLASKFAPYVSHYTGIDMASNMVELAKGLQIPNAEFICMDGQKTDFQDETFDVCLSIFAFINLPKNVVNKILLEMMRVTKKGGKIFIGDIPNCNKNSPTFKLYKKMYPILPVMVWDILRGIKSILRGGKRSLRLPIMCHKESFFIEFAKKHNLSIKILDKNIEGNIYVTHRFDVIISK